MPSMSSNSPIAAYNASAKPGTKQRTLGMIMIIVSLYFAYCHWREVDLTRWLPCQAKVVSTSVDRGGYRQTANQGTDYIVYTQLKYSAASSDHDFKARYAQNLGYYEASKMAEDLKGKSIPVRYDPSAPNCAALESDVNIMHGLGPIALPLAAASACVGFALLLLGLRAGG